MINSNNPSYLGYTIIAPQNICSLSNITQISGEEKLNQPKLQQKPGDWEPET